MTNSKIEIHNSITNEIIRRELNVNELAEFEADKAQELKDAEKKAKAEQAAQVRKQIILDRLGITGDEFNALLS